MRISDLKLTNFRSHASTHFHFDRVNVVRGLNGAGKSSLAMAIELVLTGRCQVTDAAGKGADDLISITAKEAVIEAVIDTANLKGSLVRRQSRGMQTTTIGAHAGKAALFQIELHCAKLPVLSAVLNSHRFLEMNAKEQKALLADSLGSDPVEISDEFWATNRQGIAASGLAAAPAFISSAAEVDRLYDIFYKTRTLVKRELANFGELLCPEVPADAPSLEDAKRKLQAIRFDRDVALQQRASAEHEYQRGMDAYGAAVKKLREVEDHVLESDELERLEKLAKSKSKAKKLDDEISQAQHEIVAKRTAIADWKNKPTNCDKCGAKLKVNKADIDAKIAELTDEITKLEESLGTKQVERRNIGDPDEAQRKIDRHRECSGAWAVAKKTVDLGAPAQPDFAEIDTQIRGLSERIASGEAIIEQLVRIHGAREQYEHQKNRKDILSTKIESLERLVEYFSDKGPLKGKLVGGKLPAFIERINGVLERFGFHAWLALDPYRLDVARIDATGSFRPHTELALHQLSESEQFRFSIAFQVALAEATGVGIVVVDRADMLTAESRRLLTAELRASRLEQAFILSTGEPMDDFPEVPGVAFFELENVDGTTNIRAQSCAIEKAYASK